MKTKIIHQYFGENVPLPCTELSAALAETWRKSHPTWQYVRWKLSDVRCLLDSDFLDLSAVIDDDLIPAVAPYLILYKNGGLYAGWDFECMEPFDSLLENRSFVCFAEPGIFWIDGYRLSDRLLYAERAHPFLRFMLDRLKDSLSLMRQRDNAFINKMYACYGEKETLTVLPASQGIPCTRTEIRLYERGLLSDEDIQEKIQEACSICYYKEGRRVGYHLLP